MHNRQLILSILSLFVFCCNTDDGARPDITADAHTDANTDTDTDTDSDADMDSNADADGDSATDLSVADTKAADTNAVWDRGVRFDRTEKCPRIKTPAGNESSSIPPPRYAWS